MVMGGCIQAVLNCKHTNIGAHHGQRSAKDKQGSQETQEGHLDAQASYRPVGAGSRHDHHIRHPTRKTEEQVMFYFYQANAC